MSQRHAVILATLLLGSGCADNQGGSVSCGLAALSGPLVAMQAFGRGLGLAAAPFSVPDSTPARFVAGPVGTATLVRSDSGAILASFPTPIPDGSQPGFGVLVLDPRSEPIGLLIYEGATIPGAVRIGSVTLADSGRPLFGVQVNRSEVETADCPLFPGR